MTNQPVWKLVATLGDVNPLAYGGALVFADLTGVYPPEVEVIEPPEEEGAGPTYFYRILLEPCTVSGDKVSDNPYHPDTAAWFNGSIAHAARSCGLTRASVVKMLCSNDPVQRAQGYEVLWRYLGLNEFDSDPQIHNASTAAERYARLTQGQ